MILHDFEFVTKIRWSSLLPYTCTSPGQQHFFVPQAFTWFTRSSTGWERGNLKVLQRKRKLIIHTFHFLQEKTHHGNELLTILLYILMDLQLRAQLEWIPECEDACTSNTSTLKTNLRFSLLYVIYLQLIYTPCACGVLFQVLFLPQSKNISISLTGDPKLTLEVSVSVSLYDPLATLKQVRKINY